MTTQVERHVGNGVVGSVAVSYHATCCGHAFVSTVSATHLREHIARYHVHEPDYCIYCHHAPEAHVEGGMPSEPRHVCTDCKGYEHVYRSGK